jgi:hypothetical protein
MSDDLTKVIARNRAARIAYGRRKTFENPGGVLLVTKTKRGVRLTIKQRHPEAWAQFTLTPDDIERLMHRVQTINGGRAKTVRRP